MNYISAISKIYYPKISGVKKLFYLEKYIMDKKASHGFFKKVILSAGMLVLLDSKQL